MAVLYTFNFRFVSGEFVLLLSSNCVKLKTLIQCRILMLHLQLFSCRAASQGQEK